MSRLILLLFFLTSLISCNGDLKEFKLLRYSDKNKKYEFEIWERNYGQNDSLDFVKTYFRVINSENQIINKNNTEFLFYNNQHKIDELISVYHRGWRTHILSYKYLYTTNGKLNFVIQRDDNKTDTIEHYLYNHFNQLIEKRNGLYKVKYTYEKDKLIEVTEFENDEVSKHSKFIYDDRRNKSIENWVFSGDQKMRTYFKYNSKNKLISKRDSSITVHGNPNEYVEFLTRYQYNHNDSLVEEKNFGRVLSEKDFKYRGKTTYEYKKL
ncbi:hypothetical protein [Chryseobacterium indologenes]|uniref:hypothetical protein n=1 Tax=Chryseobacterium indologenes TaxID=253 RepID=UPI004058BC73